MTIELAPFIAPIVAQQPGPQTERNVLLVQHHLEIMLQLVPSLRHNHAAPEQESMQLVDQSRSLADQPVARTMQALHVKLCLTHQLHEPHRWFGGVGDRLGIPVIIFLRLDKGTNIPGRHQQNLVILIAENSSKVMRAAARLNRHGVEVIVRSQAWPHPSDEAVAS